VPIKDGDGAIRSVLSISRDIAHREHLEEDLREARRRAEAAYRREHRIALRFQSALLPSADVRTPALVVAHAYRPTSS